MNGTPRGARGGTPRKLTFGRGIAPAYDKARAQANWKKLRTLWSVHGENMAVWGRSYKNCFVRVFSVHVCDFQSNMENLPLFVLQFAKK